MSRNQLAEAQARLELAEINGDNAGIVRARAAIKLLREDAWGGKPGPNAAQVGPAARKKLGPLLKHYMSKPHPFTSCVRDNTKRFGKDRAERVCAVLKDIGTGTTKWRNGGDKKVTEAEVNHAVDVLVEAGIRDEYDLALIETYLAQQLPEDELHLVEGRSPSEIAKLRRRDRMGKFADGPVFGTSFTANAAAGPRKTPISTREPRGGQKAFPAAGSAPRKTRIDTSEPRNGSFGDHRSGASKSAGARYDYHKEAGRLAYREGREDARLGSGKGDAKPLGNTKLKPSVPRDGRGNPAEPSRSGKSLDQLADPPRTGGIAADALSKEKLAQASPADLADLITRDWKNVNFAARPYLDAMRGLESFDDYYYQDPGHMIASYFLGNATSWKGETARAVKAEMKRRLSKKYGRRV